MSTLQQVFDQLRRKRMRSELYSVEGAAIGGMKVKDALRLLEDAGIECERTHSVYVGHFGVRVFGGERVQKRAARLLFGR